jgi:flagellar hook-basal body complex protein FliE
MDIKAAAAAYSNIAGIAQNNAAPVPDKTQSAEPSFYQMVNEALSGAVDSGYKAEKVSTLALMGKADLNDLATAVSSAEQALDTVVAIRDKIISAYQSISQMPM